MNVNGQRLYVTWILLKTVAIIVDEAEERVRTRINKKGKSALPKSTKFMSVLPFGTSQ